VGGPGVAGACAGFGFGEAFFVERDVAAVFFVFFGIGGSSM